jgi:hypothetical protein
MGLTPAQAKMYQDNVDRGKKKPFVVEDLSKKGFIETEPGHWKKFNAEGKEIETRRCFTKNTYC